MIYLRKIKKYRKEAILKHARWDRIRPRPKVSNLPVIMFNWLAPLRDRYNNAKSVTIPLPTRVRQTPGALPADRKPGCKPLPRLHCNTRVLNSQWLEKGFGKVLLIAQIMDSHTHFQLNLRHFHHLRNRCPPGVSGRYGCQQERQPRRPDHRLTEPGARRGYRRRCHQLPLFQQVRYFPRDR